jgi:hypothetical protein
MTPVEIIKIVEQIASPYFQFNMEDFYGDKNTYEHPTMEAITTLFFKLNVKDGVATLTKEEEQQIVSEIKKLDIGIVDTMTVETFGRYIVISL